jgi:hypothetical protein
MKLGYAVSTKCAKDFWSRIVDFKIISKYFCWDLNVRASGACLRLLDRTPLHSTSSGPFWSKHHLIAAAQKVATYASKRKWKFYKVTRKDCWTGDVSYSRSVATVGNSWGENLNVRTQYHHASSLTNSHEIILEFYYRDLSVYRKILSFKIKWFQILACK